MPDRTQKRPALLIPVRSDAGDLTAAEKPLPAVLQTASRGAGGGPDLFLTNVVVEESHTLAGVGRGEAPDTRRIEDAPSCWRWRPRTAPPSSWAATGCRRSWRGLPRSGSRTGRSIFRGFGPRGASRGLGDWSGRRSRHYVTSRPEHAALAEGPRSHVSSDGAGGGGMGIATKAYGFMRLSGSRTKTSQRYNARCESQALSRSRITLAILQSNPLRLLRST
jgi:hypothetical protein